MDFREICRRQLPDDEGVRSKIYRDSLGIESIGIGRNLRDVGLHQDEISYLFENDLKRAEADARQIVPEFDQLTEARKAVIVNMAFNMSHRLAGFQNMLSAIASEDFDRAANEMLDSLWAKQVGQRAKRLADMMRNG